MYIMRRLQMCTIRLASEFVFAEPIRIEAIGTVALPEFCGRDGPNGAISLGRATDSVMPSRRCGWNTSESPHDNTVVEACDDLNAHQPLDSYAERLACGSEWHAINTLMNEHYFGNPAPNL